MAKAIAFFPWWQVDRLIEVGPIRLLPYAKGKLPGDLPDATQADIDAVFKAYANRPGQRVKKAALIEVDTWRAGQDPTDAWPRLLAVKDALGFSALSERKLFRGHFGYSCFDNFTLVVQQYVEGQGDLFAYTTRRRDGGMGNMWGSDQFAFHRPLHVHDALNTSFDERLAELLMVDAKPNWAEAVAEFNRANTDSADVLPHVEMIMMKSAFEWVFEIGERADAFSDALAACMEDLPQESHLDGPLRERWEKARPKAPRPIQAWAREFCDRRGVAAHGAKKGGDRFVWSEAAHLAFGAILFPLVFKKIAAAHGKFVMSDLDRERLRRADAFILHDPFAPIPVDEGDEDDDRSHPWADIELEARMRTWRFELRAADEEAVDSVVGAERPPTPSP